METLFELDPVLPNGFSYLPDFLSRDEEERLLSFVRSLPLHPMLFQGYEAKRKVESYGYDYDFASRQLRQGKPIPKALDWLIEKVADHLQLSYDQFAEVLVSEYPPGAVINWHRDAPPFDIIAGISLLQDCTFKLRPYDKAKQNRKAVIKMPVRRQSLYVIREEARMEWEHSISPVESTRFSITLRTLK